MEVLLQNGATPGEPGVARPHQFPYQIRQNPNSRELFVEQWLESATRTIYTNNWGTAATFATRKRCS